MSSRWTDDRTLVIVWLLLFFPVGLYGVWTGRAFDRRAQWIVTGIVAAAFLVLGATGLTNLVYAVVLCPAALYFLWRMPSIPRSRKWVYSGIIAVLVLLGLGSGGEELRRAGEMADVIDGGACSYFRDSSGNVIGRACD